MARRYFKKYEPANKVVLDNGARVEFGTVDGQIGFWAGENEYVIAQLLGFIAQQRYGIEEIAEPEYAAYAEKKRNSSPLPKPWREEIAKSFTSTARLNALNQTAQAQSAAAAARPLPEVIVSDPPVQTPPEKLKVNVGPRKRKK